MNLDKETLMRPFGLTGNIGCGKSTVASLLAQFPDVVVFDCDGIAREVIADAQHRSVVESILGQNVFQGDLPDFKAISQIIFFDREKKQRLERFVHPIVWKAVEERRKRSKKGLHIVESAIIYEVGAENAFHAVITVTCSPAEQLRRLIQIRGMAEEDVLIRIRHQLPMEEKARRAQFVISTDCDMAELRNRTEHLYQELKGVSE